MTLEELIAKHVDFTQIIQETLRSIDRDTLVQLMTEELKTAINDYDWGYVIEQAVDESNIKDEIANNLRKAL